MPGSGSASSNDTISDGLKKLFPQIAQLKLLPDAAQHMQFIQALEGAVMGYLQQIGGQMAAMGGQGGGAPGGPGGPPGAPPGGSPDGGMGGPPAAAAQFQPGGASGGGNVGLSPNMSPDEMQRIMANVGGNG